MTADKYTYDFRACQDAYARFHASFARYLAEQDATIKLAGRGLLAAPKPKSDHAVTLKSADARKLLCQVLRVELTPAFTGRIDQLQKRGIPGNTNTGKGSRPDYSERDILRMAVCFDLLAIGFTPDGLTALMELTLWKDIDDCAEKGLALSVSIGALTKYGGRRAEIQCGYPSGGLPMAVVYPAVRAEQIRLAVRRSK